MSTATPTAKDGFFQNVWEGRIPVIFELAYNEVTTMKPPEPALKLVPRMSYLPLLAVDVVEHFREKYAPPMLGKQDSGEDPSRVMFRNVWFESKGQPLRWHLPVGVLFDATGNFETDKLPWKVIVHFQAFPEDQLVRFDNLEAARLNFMMELKQAVYVRFKSSKHVLDLPKDDQEQLWNAVQTNNSELFWRINEKLIKGGENSEVKRLPVRLIVSNRKDRSFVLYQHPISPFRAMTEGANEGEAELHTVEDAIVTIYPNALNATDRRVIVQGVEVSLDEPVLPLCNALGHADNFLYIILQDFSG